MLENNFAPNNNNNTASKPKHIQDCMSSTPTDFLYNGYYLDEVRKTADLVDALKYHEGSEDRDVDIVSQLEALFNQWIQEYAAATAANVPTEATAKRLLKGKVYAFGSFRLGVDHRGADLNALCVAPCAIKSSDFFDSFPRLLRRQLDVVRKCRVAPGAFEPMIKLKFAASNVNLFFASLALQHIPDDLDLNDESNLEGLDLDLMRSLDCCRVTERIPTLVPQQETFTLALRAVMMWAKRNAVYGPALGYLDDVTWSLLLARTCQQYPNAPAASLVEQFFLMFSHWDWPRPVLLDYPENTMDLFIDGFLPIIKPVYPEYNFANSVSRSTKHIILDELCRGLAITNEIMLGRAAWDSLFEEQIFANFSNRYPNSIMIMVHSQTAEDHLVWNDFVGNKIRLLVDNLEYNPHLSLVHPYGKTYTFRKGFTTEDKDNADDEWSQDAPSLFPSPFCTIWFVGLELVQTAEGTKRVDLQDEVDTFVDLVLQSATLNRILKAGMSIEANQVRM